jgi:hypothetical protein
VSERGSFRLDGGRSQREAHGLELSDDHDQGRAPAWLRGQERSLIYGPDFPATVPYQQNTNPDVLDIVVVKDFVLPVYLTVCPALCSYHLPVLIDTTRRTSFQRLLDRSDFKRVDWAAYQACLEDRLSGKPVINDEESIYKCVEELSSAIQGALAASNPKRRPRADPWPPLPAVIRD